MSSSNQIDKIFQKLSKFLRKYWREILLGLLAFALYCIIAPANAPLVSVSGFKEDVERSTAEETIKDGITTVVTTKEISGKKLWDWMSILLAPAALVGLGAWFENVQYQKEQKKKEIEEAEAREEEAKAREEASDIQCQEKIDSCFADIFELLVEYKFDYSSKKDGQNQLNGDDENLRNNILEEIRRRTLSVLENLNTDTENKRIIDKINEKLDESKKLDEPQERFKPDYDSKQKEIQNEVSKLQGDLKNRVTQSKNGNRKAKILRFLRDKGLIKELESNNFNLLSQADFSCANLSGFILTRANLRGINLQGANLEHAYLIHADLKKANLRGANLEKARFDSLGTTTNLESADLQGANLQSANFSKSNLKGAQLRCTRLKGTNLAGADLSRERQRNHATDLSHSIDLNNSIGLTKKQLEDVKLDGTTLPDSLPES